MRSIPISTTRVDILLVGMSVVFTRHTRSTNLDLVTLVRITRSPSVPVFHRDRRTWDVVNGRPRKLLGEIILDISTLRLATLPVGLRGLTRRVIDRVTKRIIDSLGGLLLNDSSNPKEFFCRGCVPSLLDLASNLWIR
jgi:hypothetical protein